MRYSLSQLFIVTLLAALHAVAAAHSLVALLLLGAVTLPVGVTAWLTRSRQWPEETCIVVSAIAAFASCFSILTMGASAAWFIGQAGIPLEARCVLGCIYGFLGAVSAGVVQYLIQVWLPRSRSLLGFGER